VVDGLAALDDPGALHGVWQAVAGRMVVRNKTASFNSRERSSPPATRPRFARDPRKLLDER
jgi:hypothetical protein